MRIYVLFLGSSASASFVVPNPLGYRLLNLSCSSVRFQPVGFHEPSDPLARGVPLKYFRFRPVAYRLHLPNFGVVIQFPPVDYLPLPPILRRQVHSSLGLPRVLPCRSCRSLPCLFPVRPTYLFPPLMFISLITVF
jgi:hypothetical protein